MIPLFSFGKVTDLLPCTDNEMCLDYMLKEKLGSLYFQVNHWFNFIWYFCEYCMWQVETKLSGKTSGTLITKLASL